jgi:hypothetical protein
MIYTEQGGSVFLTKEDFSDYVICRDGQYELRGYPYLIYAYDILQEVIAPKALAWWTDD